MVVYIWFSLYISFPILEAIFQIVIKKNDLSYSLISYLHEYQLQRGARKKPPKNKKKVVESDTDSVYTYYSYK